MTFNLKFQLSFNMASKGSVGIYVPSNYRAWLVRSHSNRHEEYNAPGCPLVLSSFLCCHSNRTQLQFALCDVHCSLEMQCCPRWTTAVLHPALSAVTKATQPLPMAWQKNKLNLQNENMVML